MFQIQTGTGFVEGTPIDLAFAINSDQSAGTSYLRLFTGVPGAEILFDNYSAMADTIPASSGPKDLTPWDIANAEPLWMADDASCLLKAGQDKYLLWRLTADPLALPSPPPNSHFLAHRLTRGGMVVGRMETNATVDCLWRQTAPHLGCQVGSECARTIRVVDAECRWLSFPENLFALYQRW